MREVEDNKMSRLFNDLFIFEMANSHQGDVEHGKDIIHEMGKIASCLLYTSPSPRDA